MPRKSWWARLPFGVRMTVCASALLLVAGGGVAGIVAVAGDDRKPRATTAVAQAAPPVAQLSEQLTPELPAAQEPFDPADAVPPRAVDQADRATPRASRDLADHTAPPAPPAPHRKPARPAPVATTPRATTTAPTAASGAWSSAKPIRTKPARPVIITRTETETRRIPFRTRQVRDSDLAVGTKRVARPGAAGVKTLRYRVTIVGGKITKRRLLDETVTRQPRTRVVAVGDYREPDPGSGMDVCEQFDGWGICPEAGGGSADMSQVGEPQESVSGVGWSTDAPGDLLDDDELAGILSPLAGDPEPW